MGAYVADALAAQVTSVEHRAHEFIYYIRCISLGRQNGLVQMADEQDHPKEQIMTGRLGAMVKELICSYTLWQVQHPRWMYFPRPSASERTAHSAQTAARPTNFVYTFNVQGLAGGKPLHQNQMD